MEYGEGSRCHSFERGKTQIFAEKIESVLLALTVFSSNFRRVSIQLFGCLSVEDQELPFQKHSMYKCPHHQHTWTGKPEKYCEVILSCVTGKNLLVFEGKITN